MCTPVRTIAEGRFGTARLVVAKINSQLQRFLAILLRQKRKWDRQGNRFCCSVVQGSIARRLDRCHVPEGTVSTYLKFDDRSALFPVDRLLQLRYLRVPLASNRFQSSYRIETQGLRILSLIADLKTTYMPSDVRFRRIH